MLGFFAIAQIPEGYYSRAIGKSGQELKEVLCDILTDGHHFMTNGYGSPITYGSIPFFTFLTTDPNSLEDSTVYDIYRNCSNLYYDMQHSVPEGPMTECAYWEQEHIFCRNWMGGNTACAGTMQASDMHNLYPADCINNLRSNYAFGIVDHAASNIMTFSNGSRKGTGGYFVGTADDEHYSGTVYEPVMEARGDIARTIFYMATRYMHETSFNGDNAPMSTCDASGVGLKPWAVAMLIEWHHADPVDERDSLRNNAVYRLQGNRNPYVDHPELVDLIWGGITDTFAGTPVEYTLPEIYHFEVENLHSLVITFNTPMEEEPLGNTENYAIVRSTNMLYALHPASVEVIDPFTVVLNLDSSGLTPGIGYYCNVAGMPALNGWFSRSTTFHFVYGVNSRQRTLAAWTFDETQDYDLMPVIPANYGDTLFSVMQFSEDYLPQHIVTRSGSRVGDPRVPQNAGRAVSFKQHTGSGAHECDTALYFTLRASTLLFENISLSFARSFTSSSCRYYKYYYSTTGDSTSYILFKEDNFNTDTLSDNFDLQYFNLSDISELNNTDSIFFMIKMYGAISGTGRASFDNFCIAGEKCRHGIYYTDTVVSGRSYDRYGFHLTPSQTQLSGDMNEFTSTYERVVAQEDDCDSVFTLTLHIISETGIQASLEPETFNLRPNPAHETVTVCGEGLSEIRLYTLIGQQLVTISADESGETQISLAGARPGIYIIQGIYHDGRTVSQKLILQ